MAGAPVGESPQFTLLVVATRDGFIARAPDHPPHTWASAEEQEIFLADVAAADWGVMGRHTHEAADKPERRRIIFSSRKAGWQRPTQLWLDPEGLVPGDLPDFVSAVHPLRRAIVLGGTRVHDWFLVHGALHAVHLTVEPVAFGAGLPIFTGTGGREPAEVMSEAGFEKITDRVLNSGGTRHSQWRYVGARTPI